MKKNIISLAFLLLPCSLWADDFTVDSAEDWQTVCSNAEAYASGTITFGADFEVTTAFPAAFTGTLDGQGHTITYNLTNPGKFGLFSSTGEGAVIKNLKIAGTIEANTGAAGVVYTVNGATTIQDVKVSATINSNSYPLGGFVVEGKNKLERSPSRVPPQAGVHRASSAQWRRLLKLPTASSPTAPTRAPFFRATALYVWAVMWAAPMQVTSATISRIA